MRIERIVLVNRAPFENLDLDFKDKSVISLTGINGSGKTTILSYIEDAFYEMAKEGFRQEFFGEKQDKYYRFSSAIYNMDINRSSLVYLCFNHEGEEIKYIDYHGKNDESTYNEMASYIGNAVKYNEIKSYFNGTNTVKKVIIEKEKINTIFSSGLYTYFPVYRYEQPGYLNDVYRMELSFNCSSNILGYLINPIEVITDLPQIANWIMDIVLDEDLYKDVIGYSCLNDLLTKILKYKYGAPVRLGIGRRYMGGARIQILKNNEQGDTIYPSIFNLSSGEASLLCMFGELLKQSDKIRKSTNDVEGIILIDEIDKHLHIKLQLEALPELMRMFPKLQFIISTHSSFVNIGVSDEFGNNCKIIDLDKNGIECTADSNGVFREAYEAMIDENERYAEAYNDVYELLQRNTKPFVITEGKSDWKHIKAAMNALDVNDIDVEFYEFETTLGDSTLSDMLLKYSKIPNSRPIIGIFDRDNFDAVKIPGIEEQRYVNIGNNVYAFSIPLLHSEIYNTKEISIEHYYRQEDLTKETENRRRLFLGCEFYPKGVSKNTEYITHAKGLDRKTKTNGIIDDKVYEIKKDPEQKMSVALSKDDFAQLIYDGDEYCKDFDFVSFEKIVEVIRDIIKEIECNMCV